MTSLTSALNWYHKKIGAYDKELWEKSVDQRILRGVCAIPKKRARLKTELIDVDLVRGSAFAKAKPQHSWIAATISGIKRVLVLPLFYKWLKSQTNLLVSLSFIGLYLLQITAMYLYFSANEKEFSDVPVSEVLVPLAMLFILGIVHSQIVATFIGKKTQKRLARNKRRRIRSKQIKSTVNYRRESKSSEDSCSDDRHDSLPIQTTNESCDEAARQCNGSSINKTELDSNANRKLLKSGQHLRFSFEDNGKAEDIRDVDESENQVEIDHTRKNECENTKQHIGRDLPENETAKSQFSNFKNIFENNSNEASTISVPPESIGINFAKYSPCKQPSLSSSIANRNFCNGYLRKPKTLSGQLHPRGASHSSDEELFKCNGSFKNLGQSMNYISEVKGTSNESKAVSRTSNYQKLHSGFTRRSSDGNLHQNKLSNSPPKLLSLQEHYRSSDNILHNVRNGQVFSGRKIVTNNRDSTHWVNSKICSKVPPTIKLPINVKNFSSSGESGLDTNSPNTPKPQTSDSEWPIITNTDCNSDSTDCTSHCSDIYPPSDLSPTENPFAWEIQEPSNKLSNVGYGETDKGFLIRAVSCTIWEHNECKKADLTALDISSAIIQKVNSIKYSSEYLYVGVFFSAILWMLPMLYRLQNGDSKYAIQDVATDVLTLTVPTSEEVIKITDGLTEIMFGVGWRVQLVAVILALQRFALSLAYFFLLSVAEKTFKQRFLFAKHFCYLTSSRRAKRSDLPHFRLNKVKNIKTWLSIRSYMKKLGPQRSVDVIVSFTFILEISMVSLLCIQLLKETGHFADQLYCWELLYWTLALGIYLLRFMIIGSKINKKYQNLSVLITEQINLYLHMEQKPHKKEELMLANNVLKLAADLLKELESPFKISGLCANSYLYNITRVVVLSAFSAVLTDVLGFKLKLYKIKLT